MKKIVLYGAAVITILTHIESLWSLIKLILGVYQSNGEKNMTIEINTWTYWMFQIVSVVAIFIIVSIFLNKLEKQKDLVAKQREDMQKQGNELKIQQSELKIQQFETQILNIIMAMRNRELFIRQFDDIEYFKTPLESDEEFYQRLPEGQYRNYLAAEYSKVLEICVKRFDKSPTEIKSYLNKLYFIKKK